MKNSLTIIIIAIIVIVVVGIISFKWGFNQGAKQYKEIIDYYFPMPEEVLNVDGKITEIQGKILSVETTIQDPYTLPENWQTKTVKVKIADETKISEINIETGDTTEIDFSKLKLNDEIRATAKQDIKDKNEFEAESIELIIIPGTEE